MERKKIAIFVLAAAGIACVVFLPGFSELHKLKEENAELERRIHLLEEHNDKLTGEMRKMEDDPEYLEKKAREKLGIIKKGELIYHKED